jgi:hypothetical protein
MSETRVVSPNPPSSVTAQTGVAAGTLEEVELEALLETGTAMWGRSAPLVAPSRCWRW